MITQIKNALFFGLILLSQAALADGTGISLDFGTAGNGVELSTGINDDFDARIGFHTIDSNDFTMVEPNRFVEISNKRNEVAMLADWHPFKNELRATAGLIYYSANHQLTKSSSISRITTTTKTDPISDLFSWWIKIVTLGLIKPDPVTETTTTSTWADFGTHTYDVKYRSLAPYVGVGYGSPVNKKTGLEFKADIGIFYRGLPSVTSSFACGTSNPVGSPTCTAYQNDLAAQETSMKNNFSPWMRRVAVGLTYAF